MSRSDYRIVNFFNPCRYGNFRIEELNDLRRIVFVDIIKRKIDGKNVYDIPSLIGSTSYDFYISYGILRKPLYVDYYGVRPNYKTVPSQVNYVTSRHHATNVLTKYFIGDTYYFITHGLIIDKEGTPLFMGVSRVVDEGGDRYRTIKLILYISSKVYTEKSSTTTKLLNRIMSCITDAMYDREIIIVNNIEGLHQASLNPEPVEKLLKEDSSKVIDFISSTGRL